MIIPATEADGPQIQEITARAGVFSQEEVECVAALWEDYLTVGPAEGGYNFIVRNTVHGANAFVLTGTQSIGLIVTSLGTISSNNPWANFDF